MGLLQVVDTVLLRNAIVLAGIAAVLVYLLLASRWSVLGGVVVLALAGLFYGQQAAFSAYVLPSLERSLSAEALATATEVQTAFEVGFAVKVVVTTVELGVEGLLGGEGPLRTLRDGVLDLVSALLILGILVALPAVVTVSSVVLSVLSAIFALRIVQAGVDFAVAFASDGREEPTAGAGAS